MSESIFMNDLIKRRLPLLSCSSCGYAGRLILRIAHIPVHIHAMINKLVMIISKYFDSKYIDGQMDIEYFDSCAHSNI